MAGVSRASLTRGPAMVTWNGASFYTRDDIAIRLVNTYVEVMTSLFGRADKYPRDLVIKIPLRLWGAWENLTVLFPSAARTPLHGASLYGTTDLPLVINARNADRITFANVQLTKLADLQLGVDGELYADVEFTAIIANSTLPETAGAFFTIDTNTFADAGFAKTNFKRGRAVGAWGAITGFTALIPQKGFKIAWDYKLTPVEVDGYGTVDMTIADFHGSVSFIPIQPTLAQLKTNAQLEVARGTLLSTITADLTMTASGQTIVAAGCSLVESGWAFGVDPLRTGEVKFETVRGFTSGVANPIATVA